MEQEELNLEHSEPESSAPESSAPESSDSERSGFESSDSERSGFEPELGGQLREQPERSGLEPELGGFYRQRGVFVDETTCIGCKNCAHVARNTFFIEEDFGRARVFRQDGDSEDTIQEAIDTCPVNCIHWVNYTKLQDLELQRKDQVITLPSDPIRVRRRK